MKDDRLYFAHAQDCISRIMEYTVDGKQAFLNDRKTQDAVLRNLHTLSESIQLISPDLKAKHPDVRWREISAFRNIVVHDYLGVDLELIWDIIARDLPVLKKQIKTILDEHEQ